MAVAILIPIAWLALFLSVGGYEFGVIAGLLSFIGFSGMVLAARHSGWRREMMIGAIAGVLTPVVAGFAVSAWEAMFPPKPCTGDDCVSVTITIPAQS